MPTVPTTPPPRRPAVLLTDFVDVDVPVEVVRERLFGDGSWMVPLAGDAAREGDAVLVRLSPTATGGRAGVITRIRLGDCSEREGRTFVPIRWEAAVHAGLFPVLDGDLELARLDHATSRVAMQASYRPPLDGLGRFLDAVVLHRVAESTVRAFLRRLAECLGPALEEEGVGSGTPATGPGHSTTRASR